MEFYGCIELTVVCSTARLRTMECNNSIFRINFSKTPIFWEMDYFCQVIHILMLTINCSLLSLMVLRILTSILMNRLLQDYIQTQLPTFSMLPTSVPVL